MSRKSSFSELAKREERLAYLLLFPALLILFIIAFYPLGSVFYYSLTDKTFASEQPTHFVGLKNYKQLLSIKVMELPPLLDENGQPRYDAETGEPLYMRPIKVLPRSPVRYREVTQFSFLGKRYVVGATDRDFVRAIADTLLFTVISVALETLLGLGVALIANTHFKGRGAMRAVMLVPWAIPTAVSSRMWQWMLGPTRTGFFNVVLQYLGLGNGQIPFLTESKYQLWAMVTIDVWKTTPFMALLLLAGLQLIPRDIYEAASVDGAGKVRQFFTLTLPLLKPTLAVALVFRTLDALRVFDLFQIVLAQKRYSMASFAYYRLINGKEMGYSSASSVIIFLLIFVFAVLYIRSLGGVEAEA